MIFSMCDDMHARAVIADRANCIEAAPTSMQHLPKNGFAPYPFRCPPTGDAAASRGQPCRAPSLTLLSPTSRSQRADPSEECHFDLKLEEKGELDAVHAFARCPAEFALGFAVGCCSIFWIRSNRNVFIWWPSPVIQALDWRI